MNDIKEKQDYLCREIIELNYDPEEFQEYLQRKKGLSLQEYTMKELVSCVQEFKTGEKVHQVERDESFIVTKMSEFQEKKQGEKEHHHEGELPFIEHQKEAIRKESSNSSTKVFMQYLKKEVLSSLYTKIFKKIERISVKIRSYTKKEDESFFGSTYVTYLVETPQLQWSVERRFKDFEWLQLKLTELLPGYPIPPIPKKTAMRSFDDKHLEDRMNIFQQFLNKLISIPEICSFEIVQNFLRVSSRQELQKIKEKFEQKLRHRGTSIQTLKGNEVVNKEAFRIELQEYQFYKKTKELTRNLNSLISSVQKALKEATEKSFQLSSCYTELYQHVSGQESFKGGQIYDLMGDFINQLGYKLDGDFCFVHGFMENYWSYDEKYLENLLGSMTKISKQQSQLTNRYKTLGSVEMDTETSNSNHHQSKMFMEYQQGRQLYRLKLSMLKEELDRHSKHDLQKLSKTWTTGLTNYVNGVKNLILTGADQLTKALCLNQGRELREVQYISKHQHGQPRLAPPQK